MESYLDFGSDSDDSDGERNEFALDSDEEEALENEKLYKMLMSKSERRSDLEGFEAEMEADLDQRAQEVESRGGMEHQKSLSRSSSTSSLNRKSSPCPSPCSSSQAKVSSNSKRGILASTSGESHSASVPPPKKMVKFSDSSTKSSTEPMEVTELEGAISSMSESGANKIDKEKSTFYDEIYFDSDESEGEDEQTKKKKKEKRSFMSNDELFYDPTSDSKDQAWVDRRRRRYYKATKASSSTSSTNPTVTNDLPTSDAILNCPACFSVLCLDCQKHSIYYNQYRAMFVMNCNIVKNEVLHVPLKEPKRKRKKKKESTEEQLNSNPAHLPANDSFNPVKCNICRTQVAVYDADQVYHFFNVLASQG